MKNLFVVELWKNQSYFTDLKASLIERGNIILHNKKKNAKTWFVKHQNLG